MAIKRMEIDGFGQLELNQVAFRRNGRIEAQCALDSTDFETTPAENGMLLGVDNITRTIKKDTTGLPVAINYTTEHMYDDRKNALKDFSLSIKDGFYPRLGFLAAGDKFTTNCIAFDDSEIATDNALKELIGTIATVPLFGTVSDTGAILVTGTAPDSGVILKAVEKTTMPDGQLGVKFQVLSC